MKIQKETTINWVYIVSVFIGMLVALYSVKQTTSKNIKSIRNTGAMIESFVIPSTIYIESGLGNNAENDVNSKQIAIATMVAYLSSFSDVFPVKSSPYAENDEVYTQNGWMNMRDAIQFSGDDSARTIQRFTVESNGNKPATVRKLDPTNAEKHVPSGLLLKGNALIGPISRDIRADTTSEDYTLPSFSVCMYGDVQSIRFTEVTTENPVIFFEVFVETPNKVRFQMRPYDASNVLIEALMGNMTTFYQWTVPTAALLSLGSLKLLSFVYTAEDNTVPGTSKLEFYIGNSKYPATFSNANLKILLANSRMVINRNKNFDMVLYAFAMYKKALQPGEIQSLISYFETEASGIRSALQTQQDNMNAVLRETQDRLGKYTEDMDQCRAKLDQCTSDLANGNANKKKRWQIEFNGKTLVSNDDLKTCGPLHINAFGEHAGSPLYNTPPSLEEKIKLLRQKFRIAYPFGVNSGTTSIDPKSSGGNNNASTDAQKDTSGQVTNASDLTNANLEILPKPVCPFVQRPQSYTETTDGVQMYNCLKNGKIWNNNKCVDSIKFGVDSSDFATRCAYSCGNNYTKASSRICELNPANM